MTEELKKYIGEIDLRGRASGRRLPTDYEILPSSTKSLGKKKGTHMKRSCCATESEHQRVFNRLSVHGVSTLDAINIVAALDAMRSHSLIT